MKERTKTSKITDFTSGSIPKQLIIFAMPLFLSNMLQVVYNMVDMIVVGNVLGPVGLSAVSVGGDVTNFMTFISMGFSSAGQVIISQYIGAGQREKIGRFVSTMFSFLMTCALLISVVCILLRSQILNWMNVPAESFEQALGYSTVCMTGLVFIYGYNIVSAVLRGMGDSKHPFIFISMAAILNLVLDIIFVAFAGMGAAGAALATVISQGASFLACVVFLLKHREEFELTFSAREFVSWNMDMLSSLVKLGTPMAIKSASVNFSKLFVNSWINSYGVEVSAFAGIANKVNSTANLVSNALNTAGSSMVGQNIAAKKHDRVTKILLNLFAITYSVAAVISALLWLFPTQIFSIFTQEEAVLAISYDYLPIAVLLFFGSASRAGMNALINGSGNYKCNFATAILDGIVMRIGLSVLFGLVLDMKYLGFWLGDALAGFTPFVIGLVFYISGAWKRGQIAERKEVT
ncbi:MAG: MATE family efflux transporter [Lachnospiraceae bacterium]|nr:MATE family efflux transporter [Lachnospiraceae bacterium]